jgi:GAF domain-containing protein
MNPNALYDVVAMNRFQRVQRLTLQSLLVLNIVRLIILTGAYVALATDESIQVILIGSGVFLAVYIGLVVLSQIGMQRLATYALIVILIVEFLLSDGNLITVSALAMLAVATLITTRITFQIFSAIIIGGVFWLVAVTEATVVTLEEVSLMTVLLGVAISVRFFMEGIRRAIVDAEQNADLLRISADIGQVTAGIMALDVLLSQAVVFVRDRFGHDHVQIFLVEPEEKTVELHASTGQEGERLLNRGVQITLGSDHPVGQVAATGELVNIGSLESLSILNESTLLKQMQSRLLIPIRDGDQIIGVMDIQSTQPNAFQGSPVQALQIVSNLLAASIRNARLFEEQQHNVQENQRLYTDTQSNLQEIQRLNRQLTRESWEKFTAELAEQGGVTVEGNRISRDLSWTQLLQQATQTREPVVEDNADSYRIAIPIMLRDEVIGAMEIEPDAELDEVDTLEIARAVSSRLAVSLENARLYEESQETTLFEQRINQIVGKFQSADTIDDLLQITLEELSDTLGAKRSAIRLAAPPSPNSDAAADTTLNGHNGAAVTG